MRISELAAPPSVAPSARHLPPQGGKVEHSSNLTRRSSPCSAFPPCGGRCRAAKPRDGWGAASNSSLPCINRLAVAAAGGVAIFETAFLLHLPGDDAADHNDDRHHDQHDHVRAGSVV